MISGTVGDTGYVREGAEGDRTSDYRELQVDLEVFN